MRMLAAAAAASAHTPRPSLAGEIEFSYDPSKISEGGAPIT
ncbi:hypothetical protein ABT294_49635 [Nonomuraea sp. NPDC000554]